jgi:hypothetical protein
MVSNNCALDTVTIPTPRTWPWIRGHLRTNLPIVDESSSGEGLTVSRVHCYVDPLVVDESVARVSDTRLKTDFTEIDNILTMS